MTKCLFFKDKIKMFLIENIAIVFIFYVILYIIHSSGKDMILWLCMSTIGMIILLNILLPTVIIPLFFNYTDLEEGELKIAIFAESEKVKIPVS